MSVFGIPPDAPSSTRPQVVRLLAAGLAAGLLAACAPAGGTVSFYGTLAEARRAGAVRRGWIPEFVPASARRIHEAHNYDSREIWLTFLLPPGDVAALVARCRPIDSREVVWPRGTRQFSWWPEEMLTAASRPESPFRFHRCDPPLRYPDGEIGLPDFLAVGSTTAGAAPVWFWRA